MRGTHTPGAFKTLFCLGTVIFCLSVLSLNAQNASCLKPYLWKKRVLLVFSPDVKSPQYNQQVAHFDKHLPGIMDRDLVEFDIFKDFLFFPQGKYGSKDQARKLRKYYQIDPEQFTVVLIGKDGAEKMRAESKLEAERLFEVIDAMPMRKQELAARRQ